MKIATYKDGSRDGQLLVVSRDLTMAHYATGIAGRLQQVLDDWNFLSPQLEELSQSLNRGKARHAFAFDARLCMAPLPRTSYLALAEPWADAARPGSIGARLARGDELLGAFDQVPQLAPAAAGGDAHQSPDVDAAGLDCCGRIALISADLAAGTGAAEAPAAIRLLSLACSWHRPGESAATVGLSFAPVALTLDELGAAWSGGQIDLQLEIQRNGRHAGRSATAAATASANAGAVGELLAECVRDRGMRHGAIVAMAFPPLADPGTVCHASGPQGLRLAIDDHDGQSLFGAIAPAATAAN